MFFRNSDELKNVLIDCEDCRDHGFSLIVKKQHCLDYSRYLIGVDNLTYEDIKEILNKGAVLYLKKSDKENEYEEVNLENIDSDFIKYFGKLASCMDEEYLVFDVFVTDYIDLVKLINWILQKKTEGENNE